MSKLESISSTLDKIRQQIPVVRKDDLIVQGSLHWDRLNNHILPVLREAEKQITKTAPPGSKSSKTGKIEIVSSINLVQSVVDAMESNDLEQADLKELLAKLSDYLKEGSQKMSDLAASMVAVAKTDEELASGEGEEKLFSKMARYTNDLPVNGAKEKDAFVLRRLPVIPGFKTAVATDTLHKIGFKVVSNDGFYTVLGDQLCIGINIAGKDKPKDALAYAKQIASVVGAKMGEQFSVMGDDLKYGAGRGIAKSKGYVWYWLVPHALLTRMNRFGGAALQDWGFAFK
jgi:hypothetical protein